MKSLLVLDGNSIINRAFYGVRLLTNSDGEYTNAVYGFLNILLKIIEEKKPDGIVAAFDLKAPTFRHQMYAEYKAQRKGMPEELAAQLPVMKEVLRAMGISILELEGYEADDIIGTVAKICEDNKVQCWIATGDKDDLQLATDKTVVLLTTTSMGKTETKEYDAVAVQERYGVSPKEFIDVKGLMGDTSDNIPGVKGIGEKTAVSLIQEHGSIAALYEKFEELTLTPSVRKKLEEGKESAFLSRTLSEINCDVPIDFSFEACKTDEKDDKALYDILNRLELRTIIKRLDLHPMEEADEPCATERDLPYITVDEKEIEERLKELSSFVYYYVPEEGIAFLSRESICFADAEKLPVFKEIFENEDVLKIGYDIKNNMLSLDKEGYMVRGKYFDVMIGAYIINASRSDYSLGVLSEDYLKLTLKELEREITLFDAPDKNKDALCDGAFAVYRLYQLYYAKLKEQNQLILAEEVEMPLVEVLYAMQKHGISADKKMLMEISEALGDKIRVLEESIYQQAGEEFNINSPKQLGVILFEKLGMPVLKKNKTGYSTNADVLEKLAANYPIVREILIYRHLAKLKSTYADGLQQVIHPTTGRIYSCFNQTITTTGRISSTEPNLQNIPVRTPIGREFRRVFTAQNEDYVLVDADYSQIELRVLAHIANDTDMKEAFLSDRDIHTATAAHVFGVAPQDVTSEMRAKAKTVNFGMVYGISDFSLAGDLGISVKEAKKYMNGFFEKYKGVAAYMEKAVQDAKEKGYAETLLGRRRVIPELKASNYNLRSFGERAAMNTPIQGTAADIIKLAMNKVYRKLKEKAPGSRLILQVHDELIVEARKEELDVVCGIVREEMENAFSMSVPLKVDLNVGKNWYETH